MTILKFDPTVQWWSPTEEKERWLAHLDDMDVAYAGDEEALEYIAIERRRIQQASEFGDRVFEDETGRLRVRPLTDET